MTQPLKVQATAFVRSFAKYRAIGAEHGIIVLMRRSAVVGAFISGNELENYERLKAREREALPLREGPRRYAGR